MNLDLRRRRAAYFSAVSTFLSGCAVRTYAQQKDRRTVAKTWSPPPIFITSLHGKLPLSILPCNKIHTWKSRKKNNPKMSGLLFGMFRRYQLEAEKESSPGDWHCWTDGWSLYTQEGRKAQLDQLKAKARWQHYTSSTLSKDFRYRALIRRSEYILADITQCFNLFWKQFVFLNIFLIVQFGYSVLCLLFSLVYG